MKKLILVAAFALLASSTAALAKERNVQLSPTSASTRVGQVWSAAISVTIDGKLVTGKTPTLRVLNAKRVISVASRTTAKSGIYRARVVFPNAGMWRVLVIDRQTGRAYEFGRVRVRAS
jgi:hypothetical protein